MVEFDQKLLQFTKLYGLPRFLPQPIFLHRYICHICDILQLCQPLQPFSSEGQIVICFWSSCSLFIIDFYHICTKEIVQVCIKYYGALGKSAKWRFSILIPLQPSKQRGCQASGEIMAVNKTLGIIYHLYGGRWGSLIKLNIKSQNSDIFCSASSSSNRTSMKVARSEIWTNVVSRGA